MHATTCKRLVASALSIGVVGALGVGAATSAAASTGSYVGCSTTYGGVSKYRQAYALWSDTSTTLGPTKFYTNSTNNGGTYQFSSSLTVQVWTKQGGYYTTNANSSKTIPGRWGTIQWTDVVYKKGSDNVYRHVATVTCKTWQS